MFSAVECYQEVYREISAYDARLREIDIRVQQVYNVYATGCAEIDGELEGALQENTSCRTKLKAYIDIAKNHISEISEIEELLPTPFDGGRLSRLTVQINSGIRNDPFAIQLYKEAMSQLRFLEQERATIAGTSESKKELLKRTYDDALQVYQVKRNNIMSELSEYINGSETINLLLFLLKTDAMIFGSTEMPGSESVRPQRIVSLGCLKLQMPSHEAMVSLIVEKFRDLYNVDSCTLNIPVGISVDKGSVLIAEYTNDTENKLLDGIRNYILNIARYYDEEFDRICFVDPVGFSNNTLGLLSVLAEGENSFVDPVPNSSDEIRKRVKNIIEVEVDEERFSTREYKKKIYVFHDFPHAYDTETITRIQQLCVNAEHYDAIVILTHNTSNKKNYTADSYDYIRTFANGVTYDGGVFKMQLEETGDLHSFEWYRMPNKLPESVQNKLILNRSVVDKSNDYIKRVGLDAPIKYKKGVRRIENIPYGVDSQGQVLTLDFENTNFATFICGASRSGKSTMLHTIISGIIKNNHPDDIEMWLIDFKMTEFSQYISHLPPHVRYILLDESPELVYDIIDKLMVILQYRQKTFMGKWQKLSDVPPEKYMPAMFVVIDEFSVMSNIIADATDASRENYALKMQTLLAKGAALGMHFIFASQGFTTGTRGLNQFSKMQVQQRIAMKTEFSEIRETLDLKSASENDKLLMEQLPRHYALVRVPTDDKGNHLKLVHVLHISDYEKQAEMIEQIRTIVKPLPKYDVMDAEAYIDKKSMVKDGNSYTTFDSSIGLISEHIDKNRSNYEENETVVAFLGEPQRLLPILPVEISNGFCENMLLIAPIAEKEPCSTVILSMAKSLKMQGVTVECWTEKRNLIFRQLNGIESFRFDVVAKEMEDICCQIRELKTAIEKRTYANKMIILIGFETILMDMSYGVSGTMQNVDFHQGASLLFDSDLIAESRDEGEMDINSFLKLGPDNEDMAETGEFQTDVRMTEKKVLNGAMSACYDAREDLKFILTHGPRCGYHFTMVYNTIGEFEQSKIQHTLFKHRVLFRTAKSEAARIVPSASAGVIAELGSHIFRYTDGLDETSYRPYLHDGVSIDGWSTDDGDVTNSVEEEYLI